MTIGEKIKYLRQKNDVTQEKLAEYLSITYQSISKWENNNALPDISLVVPLANFFGVSIDELFDRDTDAQQQEIEAYLEKTQILCGKGLISEDVALWREAVQKYPKNFQCLSNLASALWITLNSNEFSKLHEENAAEAVAICERILRDCTDNNIRKGAIQTLVYTYSQRTLSFADENKAVEYAKMAGSLYTCSEVLLGNAYFTEEGKKKAKNQKHYNNLVFMDFLCSNLYRAADPDRAPEDEIFACETAIKLWSTLIYDENFLFYHNRMADIYTKLSQNYAKLGKRNETLANLKKALSHADCYDRLPEGQQYYTSIFVSSATSNIIESPKNYSYSATKSVIDTLNNSCYDFLRNDAAFIELQNVKE